MILAIKLLSLFCEIYFPQLDLLTINGWGFYLICFYMLQVMDPDKRGTARQVVKRLIVEDGWKGLYRGLGPRFLSMSAWGTSMILAYEYLSMGLPHYILDYLLIIVIVAALFFGADRVSVW